MWVLTFFDLPVDTPKARKAYSQFRKQLMADGFNMLQYSVYGRHCSSEENAQVHMARVEGILPDDGQVRVLCVTDKQFERMRVFWGKMRKPPEQGATQLTIF